MSYIYWFPFSEYLGFLCALICASIVIEYIAYRVLYRNKNIYVSQRSVAKII